MVFIQTLKLILNKGDKMTNKTENKTVNLMLDIAKELNLKTIKKTTVGNINNNLELQFTDDNVIDNLKKWVNNDIKGNRYQVVLLTI